MFSYKNLQTAAMACLVFFLLVTSFAVISFAKTYSSKNTPDSYRTFMVSAEGKAIGVPDVAQFSYTVFTDGGTEVAELVKGNNEKVDKISGILESNGVNSDDIKTDNYLVEPEYKNFQCSSNGVCPPAEIIGYKVSQTTSVKVRDFAKVGEILAAVSAEGANNVSMLNFLIDDRTALENEAREDAISKAKSKAEATAKAGDFRIGKLISINESFGMGYMPYARAESKFMNEMSMDSAVSSEPAVVAESVEVKPGTEEVIITVNLTYSIK